MLRLDRGHGLRLGGLYRGLLRLWNVRASVLPGQRTPGRETSSRSHLAIVDPPVLPPRLERELLHHLTISFATATRPTFIAAPTLRKWTKPMFLSLTILT
jgi:hypothetical protein